MNTDPRAAAVLRLLCDAGLAAATCDVAGHDRSIAVIGNVGLEHTERIASLAPAVRAAGFRYVTLDLSRTAS